MADCPKCGTHVKVYQMSPYCKKCGIHLMFASFEGQFEKDRRIAEMSMAKFRYTIAKIKSAYVSGLPQKLKIVASLLPVVALFIPLGSLSINTPVYSSTLNFDALGLFFGPFLTNGLFGKLDAFSSGPVFGGVASALKPVILCYAVMVLSALLIFLLELLSFIGNKKVCILTSVFSVSGIVGAVMTKIVSSPLISAAENTGSLVSVKCGFIFIISAVLFIFPLVVSILCLKNPPVCKFRDGDELRVDYYKKYKKGKIALSDIPAPIYESEEDKEEKRKLIKEAYNMNDDTEEVTVNG